MSARINTKVSRKSLNLKPKRTPEKKVGGDDLSKGKYFNLESHQRFEQPEDLVDQSPNSMNVVNVVSQARQLISSLYGINGLNISYRDRLVETISVLVEELEVFKATLALQVSDRKSVFDGPVVDKINQSLVAKTTAQNFIPFDKRINSYGWYSEELDKSGAAFRWSGPAHECYVTLLLDRRSSMKVVMNVVNVIDPQNLADMRISVDGKRVPHRVEEHLSSWRVYVYLSEQMQSSTKLTEIAIRMPVVNSPLIMGQGNDNRLLGIAVSSFELEREDSTHLALLQGR